MPVDWRRILHVSSQLTFWSPRSWNNNAERKWPWDAKTCFHSSLFVLQVWTRIKNSCEMLPNHGDSCGRCCNSCGEIWGTRTANFLKSSVFAARFSLSGEKTWKFTRFPTHLEKHKQSWMKTKIPWHEKDNNYLVTACIQEFPSHPCEVRQKSWFVGIRVDDWSQLDFLIDLSISRHDLRKSTIKFSGKHYVVRILISNLFILSQCQPVCINLCHLLKARRREIYFSFT